MFYLRTTPDELFRRLRHDTHRPLLQVRDPLRKLRELFAERDPLYRKGALCRRDRPAVGRDIGQHGVMQLELAGFVDPRWCLAGGTEAAVAGLSGARYTEAHGYRASATAGHAVP